VVLDSTSLRRKPLEVSPSHVPLRWTEDLALALTILQFIGMFNTFFNSGQAIWSDHKQEALDSMTVWSRLWMTGVVAAVTFSFAYRKHRLTTLNAFSLLLLWYLGFRSPLTFAIFSIIVISVSRRGPKPIIANWKLGMASFVIAFVVLIYKQIYIYVKAGQWDNVGATLTSNSIVSDSLLNSEAMSQTHILNVVITERFHIPLVSHFSDTFIQTFASGDSKTGDASFGGWVANELFPGLKYGLASNIWAEMYSSGGWIMFFLMILIYVSALGWASRLVRSGSALSVSLICAWMPYWAFYIHRSDTYRILSYLKQYGALLTICLPLIFVIRMFFRANHQHSLSSEMPTTEGRRRVVLGNGGSLSKTSTVRSIGEL
jgi:hypothetical protein